MDIQAIRPGIYRHHKGGLYEVIGAALHSETQEELVLYRHLGTNDTPENDFWVRPRKMFLEMIEKDGKQMPRFEYLRDSAEPGA